MPCPNPFAVPPSNDNCTVSQMPTADKEIDREVEEFYFGIPSNQARPKPSIVNAELRLLIPIPMHWENEDG